MGFQIPVDEDFPAHPKSVRLCAALQHPVAWAYLFKLWAWAKKYQPDGDLTAYAPEEIEFSVDWRLADGKFYAAAVRAGFIDEERDAAGTVVRRTIHNWMRHTGAAIVKMQEAARASRDRKERWNAKQAARAAAQNALGPVPEQRQLGPIPVPERVPERAQPGTPPFGTPRSDLIKTKQNKEGDPRPPARSEERANPTSSYRMPQVAAVTLAFLSVYDAYPNKDAKQRAAQEFAEASVEHPGGEEGLAAEILAMFERTRILTRPPYAGEPRFRPTLATFLKERRWEDDESAPDNTPPPPPQKPPGRRQGYREL